jgi:multimeric flavodoxin WrbA
VKSGAKVLVIIGSSRLNSDTRKLAEYVFTRREHTLIDLQDYRLEEYNYNADYSSSDQFSEVLEQILSHDIIVFCTPVYWYAMSARMKILFDRFTDCITIDKERGRKLRGRKTAMLAAGTDIAMPEGFEIPFSSTAEYLGMKYIAGAYFTSSGETGNKEHIRAKAEFIRRIEQAI